MNHFLEVKSLSKETIEHLIQTALGFKNKGVYPDYSAYSVANLFYENSTRTRVSFELAAKKLNMTLINIDLDRSSESKGEVIEDTLGTLSVMFINIFVLRHQEEGLPYKLVENLCSTAHLVNAGDGCHAHPSQALLDMMTILENKPDITQQKIAVLGDIKHSRVARSFQVIAEKLGVGELVFIAPEVWQPQSFSYGEVTQSLESGLKDADVVMCLRVQKERLAEEEHMNLKTYQDQYMLTPTRLQLAKPDAIVLHPGPMNRNVEIEASVADGEQSRILEQVKNGVYARMAIFEGVLE